MDISAERMAAAGELLIGISGILSVIFNVRAGKRINGTPKRVTKLEKGMDYIVEYIEEQKALEGKELSPRWAARLEAIRADVRSGGTGH